MTVIKLFYLINEKLFWNLRKVCIYMKVTGKSVGSRDFLRAKATKK